MGNSSEIAAIKNKKLVFTVATGRCGTAFFAEILRLIPGAVSLHEPKPEYADVLRDVQQNNALAKKFLLNRKIPSLASISGNIYIETSHLFCKGFLEPLLELGITPALLWIRRPHRAVASSMFRGGTIPGRTEKGLQFYLSPEDPGVLPLPGWEALNDYQLCYWYCLEIERRALGYKMQYQEDQLLWAETSIVDITTIKGMREVTAALELPKLNLVSWIRYLKNRLRKVNPTLKAKRQVALPANIDELEAELLKLVQS